MRLHILGPLSIRHDSTPVPLSGRLHPKLLAGLLLNANHPVSIPWLTNLLWDTTPPATAHRQVQNTIAALRRHLHPLHPDLITRTGPDYTLTLTPDTLDLLQFEALTRTARHLAPTDPRHAADRYESALDLWRGPALSGLSGHVLTAAATRLDDTHLSTVEEYATAVLTLGKPQRILERLTELAAEHPLRQRLTARLMHALYQAGRAPEALRRFTALKDTLVDELGIEPGAELTDLHLRILREDSSLLAGWPGRGVPERRAERVPVPAQLPTDVGTFTGRDEQLAALDRLRPSGARAGVVSAITGIGGVGKTALAVHWGHSRRGEFPDGQLYVNLRGFDEREPLTSEEAIAQLLRSLGSPAEAVPETWDAAVARYQSLLAGKRVLVLLDNARTVEQVRPLLPRKPGALAIVTSRNRLTGLVAAPAAIEVGALSPRESLALLRSVLGEAAVADRDAAVRVGELCGWLPLALRVAAANLVQHPHLTLARLAEELGGESRLAQLNIVNDDASDLTAVFDLSFAALSGAARGLLGYLGLIPGDDFTAGLAAAVAGAGEVDTALAELVSAHLLDQRQPGRYRFHDLVRLYARNRAASGITSAERDDALDRMIDWYGDWSNLVPAEFSNVLAVCETLADHGEIWSLIHTFKYFAEAGLGAGVSRLYTDSALQTARRNHDVAAQLNILNSIGSLYHASGDVTTAIAVGRGAVSLLPYVTDPGLRGNTYGQLGGMLYAQGSLAAAEELLRPAFAEAETAGEATGLVVAAGNLGQVCHALGAFGEAERRLLSARATAEAAGLSEPLAWILIELGSLYLDLARPREAFAAAHRAYRWARRHEVNLTMASALRVIGRVFHAWGRSAAALAALAESQAIAARIRRVHSYVATAQVVAEVRLDLGDVAGAAAYPAEAKRLFDGGNPSVPELGEHARVLCRLRTAEGDGAAAVRHGEQACAIYRDRCPDPLRLARSLLALAGAHESAGASEAAEGPRAEAVALFDRLGVTAPNRQQGATAGY